MIERVQAETKNREDSDSSHPQQSRPTAAKLKIFHVDPDYKLCHRGKC